MTTLAALGRWREPRVLLTAQVLVMLVAFFAFGGYRNETPKIESDGKYYYQFLLSAWFDGDVDFANNYRTAAEPFMVREIDHYGLRDQITATGLPTNLFTTGPAILWSPFFAVTYGVTALLAAAGFSSLAGPSGWELHFQYSVMLAAVVYSALALVMLFDLLREHFSARAVVVGLLLTFWSTNWAYYTIFEPSMSHVYDLFTLVLFLWVGTRAVRSDRSWWYTAAGLAGGLHVLVRTQNLATVAIVIACFVVVQARRPQPERRSPVGLGITLASMAVALVPLAASNSALFGSVAALPQGDGFLRPGSPNLTGVLFSGRNGLFSHHPSLLLAAAGLALVLVKWRDHRRLLAGYVVPLGLAFLAQLWINASAVDWWGGHAFGQRRLVSALPLFAVGFCALYQAIVERSPAARRYVIGAAVVLVAANLYLTAIHVWMWSYDEPHDVAAWLFVRGPEWIRTNVG